MCIVRFQHQIPWSDLRNYINTYPSYTYKLRWGSLRNINLEPDYGKRTGWLTHKQNMSRYWIQHKLYKATKFLSQIKVHVTPKFIFYNKPNILHYVQIIWQISFLRHLTSSFFVFIMNVTLTMVQILLFLTLWIYLVITQSMYQALTIEIIKRNT